jgi:ATP adenylyltransferase
MERLWAPWRMSYIRSIDKEDEGCIFCKKPAENNDRDNLILLRGRHAFVIMNLYPYNNGHLLVVPYRHLPDIGDIDPDTASELWGLIVRSKQALIKAFCPEGFNIGINLGRTAGAGIDQHLHVHIVPRWNGDTNCLPVIGETKVISQSLGDAYDSLLPWFERPSAP